MCFGSFCQCLAGIFPPFDLSTWPGIVADLRIDGLTVWTGMT
jgi:hypothetical protein